MKPTLLLILFSFFAALTYSQTIVENPKIGMSSGSFLKIKKIELRDTVTVLWFHTNYQPGVWIRVPKETYIQPFGSKEKLFIVATKGIPLNEEYTVPASGEVEYCLFFPKMDAAVSRFDYGEGNTDPGSWFIYDIQLKPELFKPLVPEKIVGNWFRSDNAQWEISLFDSVAVYKSQVWKYGKYAEKDGEGMINLKKGSKVLTIYTKSINDSTCLFGEKRSKMKTYAHHVDESQIPADKEPYQLPVFKMDTVTYSGYIKGFSPRFPQRTGMVYVNDVLTGEQASYPLSIADNGSFTVKFVHTNPQGVFVQLPNSFQTVFVEPGKTTFQLFDNGNQTNPVLYMGDCARTNSDLLKLKNINSFDHNQMVEKVLDFSPVQYKDFCKDLQQKDLEAVASFVQTHTLSAKAEQVKKLEIEYRYASSIFEYGWNVESAWRKKNNIPNTQREIPYKSAKPDSSYFSFLTNELVNNPLGVLSSDYSTFINRLMYLEILKSNARSSFSLPEIAAEMEKAGYQLTPVQEELSIQMKGIITPELIKVDEEFEHKYGPQFKDFHQKYDDRLKGLYSAKKGSIVTVEMIKEFLIAQQIELTADETAMLLAQKEFNENPLVQKRSMFYAQFNQGISQFFKDNRPFINELFKKRSSSNRKENIQ
ncbi:MAG TPA: hypothetical protein DCL77_11610, partial [Prolixibacteraceae bacterium]|nr:hypothetical protein [Prolixibacteraceae bacterium]